MGCFCHVMVGPDTFLVTGHNYKRLSGLLCCENALAALNLLHNLVGKIAFFDLDAFAHGESFKATD